MRAAGKDGKKVFSSISDYLTDGGVCKMGRSGSHAFSCITSDCDTCKGLINPHKYKFNTDTVSYYQFESVSTGKINKTTGNPNTKTARVDYSCVKVSDVKKKLDDLAEKYLLHRYDVVHDKAVWPLVKKTCQTKSIPTLHMDFSENIKEKPKFESQSAHFGGQQHSLHCVVDESAEVPRYFFQFSDVKTHNWKFVSSALKALIPIVYDKVMW